jgi:hypothetical protein
MTRLLHLYAPEVVGPEESRPTHVLITFEAELTGDRGWTDELDAHSAVGKTVLKTHLVTTNETANASMNDSVDVLAGHFRPLLTLTEAGRRVACGERIGNF